MAPYLRRHEELPRDSVVVKGGRLADPDKLREDAEDLHAFLSTRGQEPAYGVSVCAIPGLNALEIARAVGTQLLPHPVMRASTVEILQVHGYEVVLSGQPGHATLMFDDAPTEHDWQNLQQAFGEPVHNPVARKPRGTQR